MKVYGYGRSGKPEETELQKAFPFLNEKGHVIAICGAGGKTTLMYYLAKYCACSGLKTLVATSTHIVMDAEHYADNPDEVRMKFSQNRIAVVGERAAEGKLTACDEVTMEKYIAESDIVFVEADGSKHLPCKAPGDSEPVIPKQADIVIGVLGLTAMGRRIGDVCHRKEIVCEILEKTENDILNYDDFIRLMTDERGIHKNSASAARYCIFNQFEEEFPIHNSGPENCYFTFFDMEERQ